MAHRTTPRATTRTTWCSTSAQHRLDGPGPATCGPWSLSNGRRAPMEPYDPPSPSLDRPRAARRRGARLARADLLRVERLRGRGGPRVRRADARLLRALPPAVPRLRRIADHARAVRGRGARAGRGRGGGVPRGGRAVPAGGVGA